MPHAAAGELVAEGAQQQVGVGRGHDLGDGDRPLVLLHGFTHTGASWEPVAAALAERYRPLAPGHPRPRVGVRASRRSRSRRVIADVAALTPRPFELAGYSMGGRIALHAALALGPGSRGWS